MTEWRQDWGEEAAKALLAVHRLRRSGLEVKLDKGFKPGVYGVTVEYGESVQRLGFTRARRQARDDATRGQTDAAQALLAGGANLNVQDIEGVTARDVTSSRRIKEMLAAAERQWGHGGLGQDRGR